MQVYRQDTKIYSAPMDSDALVFHQEDLQYYRLNGTGVLIWEYLREPRRAEDVVSMLLKTFEVEESACRDAVAAFLHELVLNRLVVCE